MQRPENAPFRAAVPIPTLLEKLEDWLVDDRQWQRGQAGHWHSLLADLAAAIDESSPALQAHFGVACPAAADEIKACRRLVKELGDSPPDISLRRRIERLGQEIRAALLQPAALRASWQDMVESSDAVEQRTLSRRFFALARFQGHAEKSLKSYLTAILSDDGDAVRHARGEEPQDTAVLDEAGATPNERLELTEQAVAELPREGELIVWLAYGLAPMHARSWPPRIDVGEKVTLFEAKWLGQVLAQSPLAHDLPPELGSEPLWFPGLLRTELEDESGQADSDKVPRVAVRVDLGHCLGGTSETRIVSSHADSFLG
ncbi:MAG: hypothetical protein AABM29_07040 [Actinomycetota bacterium]